MFWNVLYEFWKLLGLQNDSSADQEVGKSGGQERRSKTRRSSVGVSLAKPSKVSRRALQKKQKMALLNMFSF